MKASVLIPSYNSRATIASCLEALRAQRTEHEFEVVLVDSSEDGTGELVAERFPEVRLVRLPERTLPGRARNLAAEAARGELLLFTDADCVVAPDWVQRLVDAHAGGERYAGVGGAVENALAGNPVAWSGCLVEFNEFLPSAPRGEVALLPTCNVAYRREVFERYGRFPEDLWPSEDHLFSHALVTGGERLFFDPAIRVRHLFRPQLGAFLRHQRRLGAASATARRRAPDLPGAWLVRHPLRWLSPLVRLARIESRLLRRDLAGFLRFNLFLPITGGGLVAWGVGFCLGPARESERGGTR